MRTPTDGSAVTQHEDLVYVALIRDEIRGALRAIEGYTRDEFVADEMASAVAAYHFMRLAERPLKASTAYREAHPEIPWDDLAAIRSRTEPELFKEDPAVMWQITTEEFPPIADMLEALLPAEPIWRYRAERSDDGQLEEPDQTRDETFVSLDRLQIDIPIKRFVEICRRYDVRRVRLFGSVLRDDFGPGSDVDMMVDFGPGAPKGWAILGFDEEMSGILGHQADVMHGTILRYIRERVMAEAVTVYRAD